MNITNHGQDRMMLRGVPMPAVMATVMHGEPEERPDGSIRKTLFGVTVVEAPDGAIVTTWMDRTPPAHNTKRARRERRQAARRIERENRKCTGEAW